MAFCTMKFRGESIAKESSMNIIIPDGPGPFPVLYLLHGLSDDYSMWCRRTSIERYVMGSNLMVVMPDGLRSFYLNDPRPDGLAFEDHIVRDVVGTIDRLFPTIAKRKGRAIAGLSMGGYGAVMLAMRHPDIFCAASSHSGAVGIFDVPIADLHEIEQVRPLVKKKYDCFTLASKLKKSRKQLALRLDCGEQDFLLEQNRSFHAHLEKIGLAHKYAEYPGDHNWAYWDVHIRKTVAFVLGKVNRS